MKMRHVLAGALASLLFVAPAEAGQGFYISLEGGGNWANAWDHTRTLQTPCGPSVSSATASFDTGWAGFGAVGFAIDSWRIEIEGGYRHNNLEGYTQNRRARPGADGTLDEASAMANVIYDIPIADGFSFAVGAGAGAMHTKLDLSNPGPAIDEGDWHFAYQGIAGVNYALSEALSLFVDYRYADVQGTSFEPTPALALRGDDISHHTATAGIRFAFNSAEAPPPPAPVPPATPRPVPLEREFIVFFGFNKTDLSRQALDTIKEAVVSVHKSGSANIRVVGHADRAGSISYNQALSLRRAKSVREALIKQGLAAGAISISGRGESEPMVQTPDGAREPQNRRAHISF